MKPCGKDYLWGGSRINDDLAKNIAMSPLAESWECSTHPDGNSVAVGGEHAGKELSAIIREHPEYLGTHPDMDGDLPVLIKFIDAKADLSVQVHPDDAYAFEHEQGQRGKTEMWYVLDATPDAHLVYGLNRDSDPETIRNAATEGTLERFLQKVPVQKGDLFFIEAGTIHAIGAGALIVEVQENSNLTYRLYDYGRVDKNGNCRPIHLDKALDVADLRKATEPRQPLRVLKYRQGMAGELLCSCKYFEVYRMIVNTERRQQVVFRADDYSFRVLLCVNGCGTMCFDRETAAEMINIYKGDCIFVPADSVPIRLHGQMQLLDVRG